MQSVEGLFSLSAHNTSTFLFCIFLIVIPTQFFFNFKVERKTLEISYLKYVSNAQNNDLILFKN